MMLSDGDGYIIEIMDQGKDPEQDIGGKQMSCGKCGTKPKKKAKKAKKKKK